jgi:hypothetical protein
VPSPRIAGSAGFAVRENQQLGDEVSRNAGFGGSLFLIAVGAVLAFAVTVEAEGFNLNTIGIILMVVGGLGAILTLVAMTSTKKEEHTEYIKKDVDVDNREH